jgi:hypothetical protein
MSRPRSPKSSRPTNRGRRRRSDRSRSPSDGARSKRAHDEAATAEARPSRPKEELPEVFIYTYTIYKTVD